MKKIKKLVIANWKMNPTSAREVKEKLKEIKKVTAKLSKTEAVICPPFPFLHCLFKQKSIKLGGQDVFIEEKGSFTGEVSPLMLKDLGVEYVIVGHSERRKLGESNEVVALKAKVSLAHNLKTILCIGEKDRDENGMYLGFLKKQLENSLVGVNKKLLSNLIIAYEPIWAIGQGQVAMSPEKMPEVSLFIRKVLADMWDKETAFKVRIVYGGSINQKNAESFLTTGEADGFLVGRASLDPKSFNKILSITDSV